MPHYQESWKLLACKIRKMDKTEKEVTKSTSSGLAVLNQRLHADAVRYNSRFTWLEATIFLSGSLNFIPDIWTIIWKPHLSLDLSLSEEQIQCRILFTMTVIMIMSGYWISIGQRYFMSSEDLHNLFP